MVDLKSLGRGSIYLITSVLVAGVLLQQFTPLTIDRTNMICTFSALQSQTPVRLGNISGPVQVLRVRGRIDDPFEGRMFDFKGEATIQIAGSIKSATVTGKIFIKDGHTVDAITLTIEHADFGENGLQVATLNSQGMLDGNRGRAYLYTDKILKTAHPVDYGCQAWPDPVAK